MSVVKTVEWCNNFDKNFDSCLKSLKKLKEDLGTRPSLNPTTEKKFEAYLGLLELEIREGMEQYSRDTQAGE